MPLKTEICYYGEQDKHKRILKKYYFNFCDTNLRLLQHYCAIILYIFESQPNGIYAVATFNAHYPRISVNKLSRLKIILPLRLVLILERIYALTF